MPEMIRAAGTQFVAGDRPFTVRAVTYGTFRPRADGERFPDRNTVKGDFAAIRGAGFNTVRTYTMPPDDVIDLAADWGLRLLVGVFYEDWRYLLGASARQTRRAVRVARSRVSDAARRVAGNEYVLGLVLGNEIPAEVVRWIGSDRSASLLSSLTDAVGEADPDRMKTYGNYPSTEFLDVEGSDFLLFNLYLEEPQAYRRYLTKLCHLAGDRPLLLGEIGVDAGTTDEDELRQASVLDWQLEIAAERGLAGTAVFSWTDEWWVGDAPVDGWHFGLTRADRSERAALDVARRWNSCTVRDLDFPWPSMTVVICAYNASATLGECLAHTATLDYPDLEVIVVDDGSADDTAAIAGRHGGVRLVSMEHGGLSAARNEGLRHASSEIVAYLDADAYPTPEWPYFLALAFDAPNVVGVGGPNLAPESDPPMAHLVAKAPGGPVHVLTSDDRAEHVPGCNMAFWRDALLDLGGFDPAFETAGDDVDVCWRLLDRGSEIGFHPAAVVWHHRRGSAGAYLRQQRGYGRSEAILEARHPERFTSLGTARWMGAIYNPSGRTHGRQRIYRGPFGAAPFQSVYRSPSHAVEIANQIGVPAGVAAVLTGPLAAASLVLGVPALGGLFLLLALAVVNVGRSRRSAVPGVGRVRACAVVAALSMAQPLVRAASRARNRSPALRGAASGDVLVLPQARAAGRVLVYAADRRRDTLAGELIAQLRRRGLRVSSATAWDDFDARFAAGPLVWGEVVTSSFPTGCIQLRIRRRLRWRRVALTGAAAAVALLVSTPASAALIAVGALVGVWGVWRTGPFVSRVLGARS